MPLHWRPVGPEPASVYWQRRALVAGGLVVLLVLLSTLLTGGDDGTPQDSLAQPSAAPSPTSSPAVSALPSPSPAVAPCVPTALEVAPTVERDSYPAGGAPRLSLSITNTGAAPCTRDLGQAQVELTITSGSDRIWSSDDCAPGGDPDVVELEPGEAVVQSVTWDGRRSRPDCAGDQAQAQPGTYRVSGRLGDLQVDGASFVLTG